ncbi:MAG: hypothetical protein K8W52_36695 [Deltaproteobacteria bacterium]|nr:hypothetical protein [Deltaproteobacteria bacterium]
MHHPRPLGPGALLACCLIASACGGSPRTFSDGGADGMSADAASGDGASPDGGADAPASDATAPDATTDASVDATAADASGPPTITSFTAPATACHGSQVDLAYDFANGAGTITPGAIAVAAGAGQAAVTVNATTTYTLTVIGAGGPPATAQATVTDVAAPNATITSRATARQGDKGLVASIPTPPQGSTIAWSVLSNNATITAGATAALMKFDVTGDGTEVVLQVVVTNAAGCTTTATRTLAMRCRPPVLLTTDRSMAPGTPQYGPNNENTRAFARSASGALWAPYFVQKPATPGFALYDVTFARTQNGALAFPTASPLFLNDNTTAAKVFDVKVATDDAGDALFVWTETSDDNSYQAKLRTYRASDDSWSAAQLVAGDLTDASTPVTVHMDHATGAAIITTIQGGFANPTPHLHTYAMATRTLGPDTPLRAPAANTNTLSAAMMDFDLETNDALTGMAAWFEKDAAGVYTLYALHLTAGVPDAASGGGFDIKTLVVGSSTYTNDLLNYNSATNANPDRAVRMIATSPSGNAAVMWRVYNGLSTDPAKGQLYARRYLGGVWGPTELVEASTGVAWQFYDWAIDDAGDMIAASIGGSDYRFLHGKAGAAWAASQVLVTVSGYSNLPYVALEPTTGAGIVTYSDPSTLRGALTGAFYDPVTQTLSPTFTIDDPTQSASASGRVTIDASGKATILYVQMPAVLPPGANSARSALEFLVTCQ